MLNYDQLVDENICSKVFLSSIKSLPQGVAKIGLEMEINAYDASSLDPLGLGASKIAPQELLKKLYELVPGSQLSFEEHNKIAYAVHLPDGNNFSLEPGGQIEFSSRPCLSLSELIQETQKGLQLLEAASSGQVLFLSHGTNPIAKADHPLLVPKDRYQIMTRYFNSAANLRGLHMMRHASTVQANLDVFGDEYWADAVRLTLTLVSLTKYLFANSFYFQGQKSKVASERQDIWHKMDPTRSGFPFLQEKEFLQRCPECSYAQWARKAYVFLIEDLPKNEQPLFQELTFERWISDGYKGVFPKLRDWETHLATLFPHLRLRRFLEIRHLDAQPLEHTLAPMAFFVALVLNHKSRKRTWELLESFSFSQLNLLVDQENLFESFHKPLVDLALEILKENREKSSYNALASYYSLMKQRKYDAERLSAMEFVESNVTMFPSKSFMTHL